ncbi:MAG: hypothetical protein ACJ8HI_10150 [Massilia sp.]
MSQFYSYFKENMDALGLPAPESLFGSLQTAQGTASLLLGAIEKFGTGVTVRELIGAGTKLEGLAIIAACSAAYYAGAVVGSPAVASGRSLAGGTSLSDVIFIAKKNDLYRPWLQKTLHKAPHLYNGRPKKMVVRTAFGAR